MSTITIHEIKTKTEIPPNAFFFYLLFENPTLNLPAIKFTKSLQSARGISGAVLDVKSESRPGAHCRWKPRCAREGREWRQRIAPGSS